MKQSWLGLLVGVLLGAQGACAVAQEEQPAPRSPTAKGAARQPRSVEEILRLVDAGVSREVIKEYIEQSPGRFDLSAADIVTLKEHAVPDDVTVALVKRWAAQIQHQSNQVPLVPQGAGSGMNSNSRPGLLDPESYGFWWYYYAYPRALAAANERLLSSYSSYSGFYEVGPYPYGYYVPLPARAGPLARRFHHGR